MISLSHNNTEWMESEKKEIPSLAEEERVKPITGDQSGMGERCKPPQWESERERKGERGEQSKR